MSARVSFYRSEFSSTLSEMGRVLGEALAAMKARGWAAPDDEFWARLCLEEALVNAITHGNQGQASRKVVLEVLEEGESCWVYVSDEGRGFAPEAVCPPAPPQERGRGLCLIKHCMDELRFNKSEHRLEMRFRRGAFSNKGCVHE